MSEPSDPAVGAFSRRRFFRWTSALAASPLLSSKTSFASPDKEEKAKTTTPSWVCRRSSMRPARTPRSPRPACLQRVLAAVQKAALHPVRLHDLQTRSGEYIAKRLQCEGAVVTSGAAGAITLATAACLQYANNINPMAMPQGIDGMKNQVIVQKAHRYGYDHAISFAARA